MVRKDSPKPNPHHLRKDYAYLFERFFYYLEDTNTRVNGIVVFDEFERSRSHILVEQMERYFKSTKKGKLRSRQIIPEPFFVHSELTTGVQLADLVAYIVSWAVRFSSEMVAPIREELEPYGAQAMEMRYLATREIDGIPDFKIWSFHYVTDLRTRDEREGE